MIKFDLFKGGKKHAVTFSFDDGRTYDERRFYRIEMI